MMDRVPIKSSALRSIGYDEASGTLDVEMANGVVYRYTDTKPETFHAMMAADSPGRFYHQYLKGAGGQRITEEA
jgi:hypothetical protein